MHGSYGLGGIQNHTLRLLRSFLGFIPWFLSPPHFLLGFNLSPGVFKQTPLFFWVGSEKPPGGILWEMSSVQGPLVGCFIQGINYIHNLAKSKGHVDNGFW